MTITWLGLLLGAALGAVFTYLLTRTKTSMLQSMLTSQKENYERIIESLKLTEETVKGTFSAVATSVLDQNAERFKVAAEKDLRQIKTEGSNELDSRVKLFDTAVADLKGRLKEANDKIVGFETERTNVYARLEEQMKQMSEQEKKLISETDRLKSALTTSSAVRGRWGELVLKSILQSSGLTANIDFHEQSGAKSESGDDLKPDFIVNLPNSDQAMVIDAKSSLYESFTAADAAKSEAERLALHVEFAKKIRKRVQELGSKEYQKNVKNSLPYVIMFVPGEAAIRAAFEADPELFQYAADKKVYITSPVTIIPLIMLIANGWRQHKISEQAGELSKVVDEIGKRLSKFVERLSGVQKGLSHATKSWNEAIDVSWNGQQSVQRSIEKARELGAEFSEIPPLDTLQVSARAVEGRVVTEVSDTVVSISAGSTVSSAKADV